MSREQGTELCPFPVLLVATSYLSTGHKAFHEKEWYKNGYGVPEQSSVKI